MGSAVVGAKAVTQFVGGLDEGRLRAARKKVNDAMKNPETAVKLEYVVNKNILNKKKGATGDAAVLPPCCNKYDLLGKDRLVELVKFCEDSLDVSKLQMMYVEDLRKLTDYGNALDRPCAIPGKVWGECKAHTQKPDTLPSASASLRLISR